MEIRKSGLIIPASAGDTRPPVYFCAVCGEAAFAKGQEGDYQRHVVRCAEDHDEELRRRSMRVRAPGIFGDAGWDTEMEQWVRDHRQALLEDRKKL